MFVVVAALGVLASFAAWSSGAVVLPPSLGGTDEPPTVKDLGALQPDFRGRLEAFLADAMAGGTPLRVLETLRTYDRQAWLYSQGRTRPGAIVTNARPGSSKHETGRAADTWPVGISFSDNEHAIALLTALEPLAKVHGLKNLPAQGDYGHWEDASNVVNSV